jgi:hypothetical protein
MGTDVYRQSARVEDDFTSEERELLALGEAMGLFANARQRRRLIVWEVVVILLGVAIMVKYGLAILPLHTIGLALMTIAIVLADPWARRRAVRRAVREAPTIEPPLTRVAVADSPVAATAGEELEASVEPARLAS